MIKEYMFSDPEQLKKAAAFSKTETGSCRTLAGVWSVARRKGYTTWDGKIGARFETNGAARKAFIFKTEGEKRREVCDLKYTPALRWCRDNLTVQS